MHLVTRRTRCYSTFEIAEAPKKALVLGATGYLGQFLMVYLQKHFALEVVGLGSADIDFQGSYEEFAAKLNSLGAIDLVVNCAALSSPGDCAKDPAKAEAINVPRHLVRYIKEVRKNYLPFLVHLSTDQIYDGSKSAWVETDICEPVNDYGRTKLLAENLIRNELSHSFAILRSSIIAGPHPPIKPIPRTLYLDFIVNSIRNLDRPATFFNDEWRCPVNVFDIVDAVKLIWLKRDQLRHSGEIFNMGGSTRVSREDMARIVALVYGLDEPRIQGESTASVNRSVISPADISMDSSKLEDFVGFRLQPLRTTIRQVKSFES